MTNRCRVVFIWTVLTALAGAGCGGPEPPRNLHVAAAANLTNVLDQVGRAFHDSTGITIVRSYGATAQLAQQIENGAPIDVFLAADTSHVDQLIAKGMADASTRAIYVQGRLVLWAPLRPEISSINDLASPAIKAVGCAKPELAPYGAAAVQALEDAGLWKTVEPKMVYAPSISSSKQFADSGNVAASFTALSLVVKSGGHFVDVDQTLYTPIDQAMCVVKATTHPQEARQFRDFVIGPTAAKIFEDYGYGRPKPAIP